MSIIFVSNFLMPKCEIIDILTINITSFFVCSIYDKFITVHNFFI